MPHVRQIREWDCGVACVHMVMRFHDAAARGRTIDLKAFDVTKSVWTIDLLNIMASYGLRTRLCTTVLGARAEYAQDSFYADEFSRDEKRVSALFDGAAARGLRVEQRIVPLDELLAGIDAGNCAIVLVNSRTMRCFNCIKPMAVFSACAPHKFTGHYVVLCGYDPERSVVYYRDPSASATLCATSYENFESSRHEYGTDDDVLLVEKGAPAGT